MASRFAAIKRRITVTAPANTIKNVTVIGGGLMGSGIAQIAAQTGHNVTLVDIHPDTLRQAEAEIIERLEQVAKNLYKDDLDKTEKFLNNAKKCLKTTTDTKASVIDADLVVEAIVESMEMKHKLFRVLDEFAPPKTIFASNTSSLVISELASVTKRIDRFGGLHFFHPAPTTKLLEVVKTKETSEETYRAMLEWGKNLGKTCITCKDTSGFIVNRLLVPYLSEAIRMYERGDASAKNIDTAMKLGAGYPMGPLELADHIGLDNLFFIMAGWEKKYPNMHLFFQNKSVEKLIKEGKLGKKSGEGFYKYK